MRDVLITAGMGIVEARTAQEGLAAASELKPALILLDIRLPGMDGYAVLERLKAVRVLGHDRERPLVLVVEDDTTGRELLAHYLVEHGYSVAYAGTAAEALDLARQLQPAAISLDVLLPDEHGLQVLSRLGLTPRPGPRSVGTPEQEAGSA